MATKKTTKTALARGPFVPRSMVGEQILAGDVEGVAGALERVGRDAWRSLRAEVKDAWAWAMHGAFGPLEKPGHFGHVYTFSSEAQRDAVQVALLVVGTAADVVEAVGRDDVLPIFRRFKPDHLPGLADALVASAWVRTDLVQGLIVEGLSHRPSSDAYVLSLLQLNSGARGDVVRSDPGLIDEGVLLRLFDIEGTTSSSLAGHDKFCRRGDSWSELLLRLVEERRLDRAVVIDKTLDAIERDWPQFRTQWYLQFHHALTPTPDELAGRADRYLALLASRIPPTVTLALDVVTRLQTAGRLDTTALLSALAPVVTARGKGQVKAALKLAVRAAAAATSDDATQEVMRFAALALVSDDAGVQGQALAMLRAPLPDDVAMIVRDAIGALSPRHRPQAEGLVGTPAATTPFASAPRSAPKAAAVVASATPEDPLGDARRLDLIETFGPADTATLVELVAAVVEDDTDADRLERAFAGLARWQREISAAPSPWAALRKRVDRVNRSAPGSLRAILGAFLAAILDDTGLPAPAKQEPGSLRAILGGFLAAILDDTGLPVPAKKILSCSDVWEARCHEALRIRGVVPLATPTHADGALRASELIRRLQAMQAARVEVPVIEGQVALLRVVDVTAADVSAVCALPDSDFVRALRYVCGDANTRAPMPTSSPFAMAARRRRDGPFTLQAPPRLTVSKRARGDGGEFVDVHVELADAPMRHPATLDVIRPHSTTWGRDDFAGHAVAAALSLWPTGREALFADGIDGVANNLDWWEARWHQAAWFAALRSPWSRCDDASSMTTAMLLMGLAGKEPGQVALAVDSLVHGLGDGRMVPAAIGLAASPLLDAGLFKGKRLAASLGRAAAADAGDGATRHGVRQILEQMLSGDPADAPRDVGALLELLVHLRDGVDEPLPEATRAWVSGLRGGGQVARERRLLLASTTS